ncbi:MAG: peptidase M28, partial [Caulobacter sp.]|nr:peptidase M28 [Caulobacter sp.]
MRFVLVTAVALAATSSAFAAPARDPAKVQPVLKTIATDVDAKALEATIRSLIGFGTRHTLSDTTSDTRGIGAARRWTAARFAAISKDCGGCLMVETPSKTFTGKRAPNGVEIVDVLGIQHGTTDPDRVVIIAGHIDSRVNDVMDAITDAPGANDDASG